MEKLFLKIYCGREESKRGKGKVVKKRQVRKRCAISKGKKSYRREKNNISEVCKKEEK